MTFKELRRKIQERPDKALVIRWRKSGIVEIATLTPSGAINITNAISKKTFKMSLKYQNVDIEIVPAIGYVTLGELLPKSMRK